MLVLLFRSPAISSSYIPLLHYPNTWPGKDHDFENVKTYMNYVAADPNRHSAFMAGYAAWVDMHNENPENLKLKSARDLIREKTLEVAETQASRTTLC